MKRVYIQTNCFFAKDIATTQEDNHHGVIERWDLFSDVEGLNKIGSLVKHPMGIYSVLHTGAIRYTFGSSDIGFLPISVSIESEPKEVNRKGIPRWDEDS